MNATIQRWGNSQGIRIPKAILAELDLHSGSQVTLDVKADVVVMKPIRKTSKPNTYHIKDLLKNWPKTYRPGELFRDKPKGNESW
ncbi:MAG: AbrB/MazE/SpoVT family DNA-binding domain-containing protein [Spirochaetes bacterium]|nr:AbrB/MazE/SpoVT family DNA-binding domain-containing protein [Spirochaetota bacterium]